jgi:hypothetical protein
VGDEISQTAHRIRESIGTGEILRCVYFGGSSAPGQKRPIVPLSIDGPYVWARCLNSGQRKRYLLGKMRILEEGQPAPDIGPPEDLRSSAPRRLSPVRTISDVLERHSATLEAQGWSCVATEDALSIFLISDDGVRAEIGLGFDAKRRQWAVARKGKRRVFRPTLKGATTQLLRFADEEGELPRAKESAAEPRQRNVLRAAGLAALALTVGVALGLLLG